MARKEVKSKKIRKNLVVDKEIDKDSEKSKDLDLKSKKSNTEVLENKKKIKTRKIKMSISKAEEEKLDKEIAKEDNVSVLVMVIILTLCFVVGISLGYILYRIAITGSV